MKTSRRAPQIKTSSWAPAAEKKKREGGMEGHFALSNGVGFLILLLLLFLIPSKIQIKKNGPIHVFTRIGPSK
jgi:hypothetical protein